MAASVNCRVLQSPTVARGIPDRGSTQGLCCSPAGGGRRPRLPLQFCHAAALGVLRGENPAGGAGRMLSVWAGRGPRDSPKAHCKAHRGQKPPPHLWSAETQRDPQSPPAPVPRALGGSREQQGPGNPGPGRGRRRAGPKEGGRVGVGCKLTCVCRAVCTCVHVWCVMCACAYSRMCGWCV